MDIEAWRKRSYWRAHHRGVKEADMLVGGFADRWLPEMDEDGRRWFDVLLDEQDVDILAWAFGTAAVPDRLAGLWMQRLMAKDYLKLAPR